MADAQSLITSVRRAKTFFAEALMYLAHPWYQQVCGILNDGRLGELRAVEGSYAANIHALANPLGKGTIYNLGCYPASLLQLVMQTLCGPTSFNHRQMFAVGNRLPNTDNLGEASTCVKFNNAVTATLHSTDTYGMAHAFRILGDNGVLEFVSNPWLPGQSNHLRWRPFQGTAEDIIFEDKWDSFYHQIQMVEQALASGHLEPQRPSPRHQDSLELMAFLTQWDELGLA